MSNLRQLRTQLFLAGRPHKLHPAQCAGVQALAHQLQCCVQSCCRGCLRAGQAARTSLVMARVLLVRTSAGTSPWRALTDAFI